MATRQGADPEEATAFARSVRLHRDGLLDEATAGYRALLARRPDHAGAWGNLGIALRNRGAVAPAVACYRRALEIAPSLATLGNLANALKDAGRFDEAIAAHRACLAQKPDDARAHHNHGITLKAADRLEEALVELELACRLAPDAAGPEWDRALVLLALGRFGEGWLAYESRWRLPAQARRQVTAEPWDGRPYRDRTLLVYPEQGFGDAILAARFLPAVRALGGRTVLACKPELRRLFAALPGVDRLAAADEPVAADLGAPIMSLPGILGANADILPAPARLDVPEPTLDRMRALVAPWAGRFKVGIVWSGSTTFKGNALRATTLQPFLRLAEVPGVQLFSLQKGPPAAELAASDAVAIVADLTGHCIDFADTAALIAQLDLVVMTDSAVAHLAGSLGKPVWNLLNLVPYWLYLREREDTPWYPSMRLFRQRRHGDWDDVFARVTAALADAVTAKACGRWPG